VMEVRTPFAFMVCCVVGLVGVNDGIVRVATAG
jgi:hypothetical protein